MIRTPLRPLARILSARARGENPDSIERENIRLRQEKTRDRARARAEGRLLLLGIAFTLAFTVIGGRMGLLAATEPSEPRSATSGAQILTGRADLTDRNGRILATNLLTHSLYAQPRDMVDPTRVATELARIFPDPDMDAKLLLARFTDGRSFVWVRKTLSPEQMQAVHDIGDPGLLFGPREMRLLLDFGAFVSFTGVVTFRNARDTREAARLAARLDLPLVATHPVQFIRRDEYRAHEARVCIAAGVILANPRRVRRFTEEQ